MINKWLLPSCAVLSAVVLMIFVGSPAFESTLKRQVKIKNAYELTLDHSVSVPFLHFSEDAFKESKLFTFVTIEFPKTTAISDVVRFLNKNFKGAKGVDIKPESLYKGIPGRFFRANQDLYFISREGELYKVLDRRLSPVLAKFRSGDSFILALPDIIKGVPSRPVVTAIYNKMVLVKVNDLFVDLFDSVTVSLGKMNTYRKSILGSIAVIIPESLKNDEIMFKTGGAKSDAVTVGIPDGLKDDEVTVEKSGLTNNSKNKGKPVILQDDEVTAEKSGLTKNPKKKGKLVKLEDDEVTVEKSKLKKTKK